MFWQHYFPTYIPNSALISATDGAARILASHLLPRHDSNPSRITPDWNLWRTLNQWATSQRHVWAPEKTGLLFCYLVLLNKLFFNQLPTLHLQPFHQKALILSLITLLVLIPQYWLTTNCYHCVTASKNSCWYHNRNINQHNFYAAM